ncbi:MAG: hypothetical protein K2J06_02770, partial [Muribaculaceae bacterium]|nr:hypothetical protein [Muribaculaceae bacterium]
GNYYKSIGDNFNFIINHQAYFTKKDYDALLQSGKVSPDGAVFAFDGINNGEVYLVCKNDYNVFKRYSTLEFSKLERRPHLKCPK